MCIRIKLLNLTTKIKRLTTITIIMFDNDITPDKIDLTNNYLKIL